MLTSNVRSCTWEAMMAVLVVGTKTMLYGLRSSRSAIKVVSVDMGYLVTSGSQWWCRWLRGEETYHRLNRGGCYGERALSDGTHDSTVKKQLYQSLSYDKLVRHNGPK